jgi:hypothetical protein
MKRELGSAAGLLAILAVVIHAITIGPEGVSSSRNNAEGKKSSQAATTTSATNAIGPEGPWIATQAFFNSVPAAGQITLENISSLSSAERLPDDDQHTWGKYLGLTIAANHDPDFQKRWAIVATVADPAHSRFQLFFDEQIASIKLAVANQRWEFAGQWLPWRDGPEATSSGIEEKRKERQLERNQEALPGILIFRRWPTKDSFPDVLFVLVVGETPTNGIAGDAFFAALNLAGVLSPKNNIGLLAPTFSGSFESLTRYVEEWKTKNRDKLNPHVYGGSISSSEYAEEFSKATGFNFSSGIVSSKSYLQVFEESVLPRYHSEGKAAYWVEDDSGFSASFQEAHFLITQERQRLNPKAQERQWLNPKAQERIKVPIYTFPREISHLRNAYQDATQSTRNTIRNVAPRLDFSLKDPSHGEDSIPVYSDTHTPVAQSAAISTVTEEFRREGIQIVFIAASNILDSLLLARFVRNESPNTKVVIGDADLLFIPAASQDSLAGTLFLSTYPMFTLGNEWLTLVPDGEKEFKLGEKERHFVFPGAGPQGIFNVTQRLLADLKAEAKSQKADDLHGYRQLVANLPSIEQEHPGLWLLELTHYGFLPVDWFKVKNENCWFATPSGTATNPVPTKACTKPPDENSSETANTTPLEKRFPLDGPSHGWYIASISISIAMLVGCCLLFKWKDAFDVDQRFPAMLGACLSATAAQLVLVLPAWRVLLGRDVPDPPSVPAWMTFMLTMWATIALWVTVSFLFFRSKSKRHAANRKRHDAEVGQYPYLCQIYAAVIFIVFALISAELLLSSGFLGSTDPRVLLFRLRALQTFSEGSPILPLFIFSIVFCIGFLLHLWRYTLSSEKTPPQLAEANKEIIKAIESSIHAIESSIHAPFRLNKQLGWRLGICALLVTLAMLNLWDGVRAFEIAPYNWALYTAIAVLLLSIATGSWDLVRTWLNLEAFFDLLKSEVSLSKEAFEHVTQQWPGKRVLAPWRKVPNIPYDLEKKSSPLALFCCHYIVYAARQTQLIAWTVSLGLLSLIGVLTTYSPQAPQHVGRFLAVVFFVIGGMMIWIFSAMEKNATLSRIEGTEPRALNFEFWIHATAVAAIPLVGVLIHLFPSLGSFVSSWLAPSLEALR